MERRRFIELVAGGLNAAPRASEALGLTIPQSLLGRVDEVIE